MLDRILILQHRGGEYISINISSLSLDKNELWETIERAEKYLIKPFVTSNVALQILNTNLSVREIEKVVKWLNKMNNDIHRLALIGANFLDRLRFKRIFNKTSSSINFRFIYDWETAKDWLVGKLHK